MADASIIAAVTKSLSEKLKQAKYVKEGVVRTDPLDKLSKAEDNNQALNLCLYQIVPNAHWRNMDIPWRSSSGEIGRAPLALDLRYLLTATRPEQLDAQNDLSIGMGLLHDRPILDMVEGTVAPFERPRIAIHPLSLDEMEKLWAGVTTPRLLSVAYEVSVVLIESQEPAKSPLPVLSRGTGKPDSIEVQSKLYPAIGRIEIGNTTFDQWLRKGSRSGRTTAQMDDSIVLYGEGMADAEFLIIRSLLHKEKVVKIKVEGPLIDAQGGLHVTLSNPLVPPDSLPAGPCSFALWPKRPWEDPKDSIDPREIDIANSFGFFLAPTITEWVPPIPPTPLALPASFTVRFKPKLLKGQRVELLVGNQQIAPDSRAKEGGEEELTFTLDKLPGGKHPARLRVDGVDSIVVDLTKPDGPDGRPEFKHVIEVPKP